MNRSLAPGAANLLATLTDKDLPGEKRVDVSKAVKDLSVEDWLLIAKAFDEWPFAPEARFKTIHTLFIELNLLLSS